uniref:NADH dehydrogenase [ubiquinone] 1 alpha subcomplex subunit 12 n=1 Tax=Esox lucius TaxID=8010 RepID=A0AAY5K9N7_ESOLU
MAEYLHVFRRALGQLGGHGGVKGLFVQLFRANDVKTGALIGVDKYGNKYFEDKRYFFGRHRWVIYTTEMNGKNTMWDVDGSMVPAEWYFHYFLHYLLHFDSPKTNARILHLGRVLNLSNSICRWMTDFLTRRRQHIQMGMRISNSLALSAVAL